MDSFAIIIFGITGNLAQKYLIPTLYDMEEKDLLPKGVTIVGIARRKMSDTNLKEYIHQVLHQENIHHKHKIKMDIFKKLCARINYISGEIEDQNLYAKLKEYLKHDNRIYYLATYPDLYHYIFENLQKHKLNIQNSGWVRLMIEKPIGHDLSSAKALNELLLKYFEENQIFRIDHYLGKETVQNILTFRFANGIFEPLINKEYIDHIQITATEDFGIGKRGGYYDLVGALKDVGQNHLLQMLAFATMDAPSEFSNEAVTLERIKILKNLVPLPKNLVFGQYEGYRQEENVDSNSQTETFFAFKTYLNSERFKDVPIYVRAGKKLKQTATEISMVFKEPSNKLFKYIKDEPNVLTFSSQTKRQGSASASYNNSQRSAQQVLIYRIQPNEGIVFKILTKTPGHKVKLKSEYMQYCYRIDPHTHYIPDPYERLLVDIINGDQTFFNDAEEVEAQWAFIDEVIRPSRQASLIDPLAKARDKPYIYKPGAWGPKEADELLEADGRTWLEPSMDFCRI